MGSFMREYYYSIVEKDATQIKIMYENYVRLEKIITKTCTIICFNHRLYNMFYLLEILNDS